MRVMHVSEALGGGVQAAINYWATETAELEHIVVGAERPDAQIGEVSPKVTQFSLAKGHLMRMVQLSFLTNSYRPDVIHAHSSLAGVYVRMNPFIREIPIVYSPHCFAFERTDIGKALRTLFKSAESLMSFRTSTFVTVSEHESRLCHRFLFDRPACAVPVFRPHDGVQIPRQRTPGRRVIAVGRICPQKDPAFMAGMVKKVLDDCPDTEFLWVGDGDADLKQELISAGMSVSGWRPREETQEILRDADVFVHSAAWEGSPVSIEEALAAAKPVVARWLPVLADRGLTLLARTPSELADLLVEQLMSDQARKQAGELSAALAHDRSDDCRQALVWAYDDATRHP